jgi:hypothetical protein
MARWYYEVAGRETGPVPETKIVWLLSKGSLAVSDRIRLESEEAWRSLDEVPEFAAAVNKVGGAPTQPAETGDSGEWSDNDLDSMLGEEAPVVARRGEAQSFRAASAADRALSDSAEADLTDLDSMLSGIGEAPAGASRKPAAAAQVAADDQWYYKSFGQEMGPVSFADVSQMAEDGVLHSDDYVRKGETGAWQRAGRMPQLKFANLDGDKDRLKDSVASFTLSSQRFGERGLEAMKKKAAEETVEEEIDDEAEVEAEAPEPVKPKKPPKRRKRRPGESADDFAAALLEEEAALSPPTPRPSYRDYQPSGQSPAAANAPADPGVAAAAPAMSAPRPVFTPPPAAPAFQRGPSKSSGGAKFNFDPKMAGIAGGVLAIALAGYFIPWKSFLGGPGKADYEVVAAMFGRLKVLHEKKAGQSDWDAAKKEMEPEIKKSLASLRPMTRTNIVAKKLYVFQADGLKPILADGAGAKDELFEEAEGLLTLAKKVVDKK